VTLDTRFFDSDGNRPQECATARLRFAGNIQSFGDTCPKGGLQGADSRMSEAFKTRVRAAGGDHFESPARFSGILGVPEQ
jgi:hypothetical protein